MTATDFVFFGLPGPQSDALRRVLNERWEVLWPGRVVVGINADGTKHGVLDCTATGDGLELEAARARVAAAAPSAVRLALALAQLEEEIATSRLLTHQEKLRVIGEQLEAFFNASEPMMLQSAFNALRSEHRALMHTLRGQS